MTGASEQFIEYGVSYRNEPPRQGSWTPDYERAAADAAWRDGVHGKELGPISVKQRVTTITSTPWSAAVRPVVEPLAHQDESSQTEVAKGDRLHLIGGEYPDRMSLHGSTAEGDVSEDGRAWLRSLAEGVAGTRVEIVQVVEILRDDPPEGE